MNLLGRRAHLVSLTASRTMGMYGAMREARGRLSARRSPRARVAIAVAGATGLVAGLAGGFALGSRFAGGCAREHDHAHADHELADLPSAAAEEQAANGALTLEIDSRGPVSEV